MIYLRNIAFIRTAALAAMVASGFTSPLFAAPLTTTLGQTAAAVTGAVRPASSDDTPPTTTTSPTSTSTPTSSTTVPVVSPVVNDVTQLLPLDSPGAVPATISTTATSSDDNDAAASGDPSTTAVTSQTTVAAKRAATAAPSYQSVPGDTASVNYGSTQISQAMADMLYRAAGGAALGGFVLYALTSLRPKFGQRLWKGLPFTFGH